MTSRVPRGVPTGGRFAAQSHAEAEGVTLVDPEPRTSPDLDEINDFLSDMRSRFEADIDDDELDWLTHKVNESFKEAQRRTAATRQATAVGVAMAETERAIGEVGEELGLEFVRDPHVDFDDWQAPLGNDRFVVLDAGDTNRITFVGSDGQHHSADVVEYDAAGRAAWPGYANEPGRSRWLAKVKPAVERASGIADLGEVAASLEMIWPPTR